MITSDIPLGLRERKKLATHRALASAAVRLAAERGLEHVTVEDISAHVGVSARTFFNYFATKEDAIVLPDPDQAARAEQCTRLLRDAPPELSPVQAVHLALRDYAEYIEADREDWLLRLSVIEGAPALTPRLVTVASAAERGHVEAIARRTGHDPDADFYPTLLFMLTSAAFHAALRRWHRLGGDQPLVDLVDTALEGLAAGLPQPSPSAAPAHQHPKG